MSPKLYFCRNGYLGSIFLGASDIFHGFVLPCSGYLINCLRGHNYKVTSIAKNALKNNKKLSYVIIGKNVRKIGKKAFYGCKKLRYIYVKSKKLTENNIGGQAFGGGYHSPRVKTAKNIWKQYSNVFLLRGMSKKALFVIDPVKLVI